MLDISRTWMEVEERIEDNLRIFQTIYHTYSFYYDFLDFALRIARGRGGIVAQNESPIQVATEGDEKLGAESIDCDRSFILASH